VQFKEPRSLGHSRYLAISGRSPPPFVKVQAKVMQDGWTSSAIFDYRLRGLTHAGSLVL